MLAFIAVTTLVFALLYALLILYFRTGLNKLDEEELPTESSSETSFSILIPARNEAKNIENCLIDIIVQHYPASNFEILVIDDFSEDDTADKVRDFGTIHPGFSIRLIHLSEEPVALGNSYKKAAISAGIKSSRYDWIITSDADCQRGKQWLKSINDCIISNDPILISGPVCFNAQHSFFGKAQSIEFMGLIGIGAASITRNHPNLCNGANLIYRKDAFCEVEGFNGNDEIASGDDEFLMHKIHQRWPGRIVFLKNPEAIVYTEPEKSLSGFIQQRKRWVSKSRKYTNKNITAILSGAWLFHLCLLFCLVAGFFNYLYFIIFLLAFGIKVLAEYLFLSRVARFFNQKAIVNLIIPCAFLYIFYVLDRKSVV